MWHPVLRLDVLGLNRLAVIAASLLFLSVPLAAAEPQLWKDWAAGCDQVQKCRAIGLPREGDPGGLFLVLDRDRGSDGALQLRLASAQGLAPGRVNLVIDGKPFGGRVESGTEAALWQGEEALLLARALAASTSASANVSGKTAEISVSGASAAMLFIDEAQGRVGTKGAFVRPWRQPDGSQPLPRPMVLPYRGPRTAPAPATLAAELRKRGVLKAMDCSGDASGDMVHPLDATTTLVLLACESFAYNVVQQAFLVRGGDPATAQPAGGELAGGLMNADFDPRERTLGSISKGRGSGDCGSIDRWTWTGKAFVRSERTMLDVCRGVPPQWWITVERTALAVAL